MIRGWDKCISVNNKPELLGGILINTSSNRLGFLDVSIDLFILYIIITNQWNGAEATRLLREVEERLRPRRRSRGGSASSPRKASGCSAMERTCSSNVTQ